MTVKELKEKLNKFDETLKVVIPDPDDICRSVIANTVYQGINEFDGCLFIEYLEED